jgi:hypothetical protein
MGDSTSVQDLERAEAASMAQPLPEDFEFTSAGENPMGALAALSEAGIDQTGEEIPLIEDPSDDTVNLPGGLVVEGKTHRRATVRELNGEDEEFLARALAANDFFRYQQVLLEKGVTHLGPHQATPELLDSLIVGDRDTLVLGVRIATYGPTLDLDVTCEHCAVESKIRIDFQEEVPIKPLNFAIETPHQMVDFRKGGYAMVRLATGADQRYLTTLGENKTRAEINSALLARTVQEINGKPVNGKADILALGMGARSDIVDWMAESQPGPEYAKVKFTCTICGKETPLGLTTGDMFRG